MKMDGHDKQGKNLAARPMAGLPGEYQESRLSRTRDVTNACVVINKLLPDVKAVGRSLFVDRVIKYACANQPACS